MMIQKATFPDRATTAGKAKIHIIRKGVTHTEGKLNMEKTKAVIPITAEQEVMPDRLPAIMTQH